MDKGTKRLVIGGAIAGGGMLIAAGLILGAGLAHAEPDFVFYGSTGDHNPTALAEEMQVAGWPAETTEQARETGLNLCSERLDGISEHTLVRQMENRNVSIHLAVATVSGAEYHFCPTMVEKATDPDWGGTSTPPMQTLTPGPSTLAAD